MEFRLNEYNFAKLTVSYFFDYFQRIYKYTASFVFCKPAIIYFVDEVESVVHDSIIKNKRNRVIFFLTYIVFEKFQKLRIKKKPEQ